MNELTTIRSTKDQTDPLSPMEREVHDWIYATEFYQNHAERIEVLPQFPLGDYLKQLDSTYSHPAWKVDFLLTISTEKGNLHIVLEYDGFEFHFKKGVDIDVGNHERYLNESDIERQLTLESYGYRFIRLNRFNIGRDPVASLSERLKRLVESYSEEIRNDALSRAQTDAAALLGKKSKVCQKCKSIKPLEEFFDPMLRDGRGYYGRNCLVCKDARA